MRKATEKGVRIHLPTGFVCGDKFDANANVEVKQESGGINPGWMGLDIGMSFPFYLINYIIFNIHII